MRVLLEEEGSTRFRISKEGISVEDDQLIPVADLNSKLIKSHDSLTIQGLVSDDGKDHFRYKI